MLTSTSSSPSPSTTRPLTHLQPAVTSTFFGGTDNLTPSSVTTIKNTHKNVKVALSLGGDSVGNGYAYFNPSSFNSWVNNAVSSLTRIIKQYNLDGIDIDYEQFKTNPETFAECIGQLVMTLKNNCVISSASIAPYEDDQVQAHHLPLWRKYGHVIDYVNFQFYAYDSGTMVSQFLNYFEQQSANYKGGKVLASFTTDKTTGGSRPEGRFFCACTSLKMQGKLHGIFIWSADDSMNNGFRYERTSQAMLASDH